MWLGELTAMTIVVDLGHKATKQINKQETTCTHRGTDRPTHKINIPFFSKEKSGYNNKL